MKKQPEYYIGYYTDLYLPIPNTNKKYLSEGYMIVGYKKLYYTVTNDLGNETHLTKDIKPYKKVSGKEYIQIL